MLKPNLMVAILAICAGLTACSKEKPAPETAPKQATATSTTASSASVVTTSSTTTTTTKVTSATASTSAVKGTADPYEGLPEKQKY